MKTNLRDYFHALNVLYKSVDVSVDGTGARIAVEPPINLTPKGEEVFGAMLDNPNLYVDVEKFGNYILSDNDDDYRLYEESDEGNLALAKDFIYSLAGNCSCEDFDEWFEGDDAKLI